MRTRIFPFLVLLLAMSCDKDRESSTDKINQNESADAEVAEAQLSDGDIIFDQSGQKIVYHESSVKECRGANECPLPSDNFLDQCVKQGYEVVTYDCCHKACTGKVD